jgi:hypothetical protein
MALTESTVQDKIEAVGDFKTVQIRTARVIYDDGTEINRSFTRHSIDPCVKVDGTWTNTDISGESAEVQAICNALWTDAIRTAYQNHVDSLNAE